MSTRPAKVRPESSDWSEEQHEVWNRRAGSYDKLEWVRKNDFLDAFVRFCAPRASDRVLDVGTGPGIIAAAIAPLAGRVDAIDISEAMITQARATHAAQGNVHFELGDVEGLQFPEATFDLVTARMVFHHVGDCPRGLAAIRRVLRPGGRLVLCEGVPPDHLTRDRYVAIFELKEKRHTFSEAELINMFDHAGFRDVLLQPYFMRQVSMNNWLANGALEDTAIREIRRLHLEADGHFKRIYRLREFDGDILMDWKFAILRGFRRDEA